MAEHYTYNCMSSVSSPIIIRATDNFNNCSLLSTAFYLTNRFEAIFDENIIFECHFELHTDGNYTT